ncbi:hypothetical protein [Haloferula sp.]|uniref:hypothetical protein n=1 Tax=Haloferula sp. TaxID=2497595 RepID=UPI003C738678
MKPIITIAETTLPDGSVLALQEHDGRRFLLADKVQVASPATRISEHELARIACAPFRPVRQPRIFIAGLALGELLEGLATAVPQKRATFYVGEASKDLADWHREFYPEGTFATDKRVFHVNGCDMGALKAIDSPLHAILVHADTAPVLAKGRGLFEDRRWLSVAYDSLLEGGLLAVASSRKVPNMDRNLENAGFEIAYHQIDANPNARRPKIHHLWLGRKGDYTSQ